MKWSFKQKITAKMSFREGHLSCSFKHNESRFVCLETRKTSEKAVHCEGDKLLWEAMKSCRWQ